MLFGENIAIPQTRIAYDSALLQIVAAAAGEGESAGMQFASTSDELFAAEHDWLSL